MRFGILGSTDMRRADGTEVAVGGPRVRALLALLALDAGRTVRIGPLLDRLYGDAIPANSANALQSQVSRLRAVLRAEGAEALIESPAGGYRLAVDPADVDAHRFERLAFDGRAALAARDPHRAADLLTDALALWRGEALADAPHAGPTRFDELRLDATEGLLDARIARGETPVAELRDLVAVHPLRERPHALLVRALHADGRRAESLTAFDTARRILADELGIDPSRDLAQAHLDVLRDTGAAAVTLRTPPAQLTSFVGRTTELNQLRELLGEVRLVTLTGPGGTGKTRLAIEAAHGTPWETCFVELAALTAAADVPQAVLTALGLREETMPRPGSVPQTGTPADRAVSALTGRPVLLVLDNCEHLIDAAAEFTATLLGSCPSLRVLATSREPLGITGENLLPVPRLDAAPVGTELGYAVDYPAVLLFADRATASRADFALDADTLPDVLRICTALDGLPLAIELAAARVRSLPTAELAARIGDRFSLLSKGSRTAASRHRTLRGVVEWSWDLLDADERTLARRLAVFSGGAGIAAAEAVCGPSGTVEVLSGLVDKSLVENVGDRYRMLQTIHAFCAEQLAEAGETDRYRRRHAEYFRDLAERASPHLLRAEQLDWLVALDVEYDNLHAALRWAIDNDIPLALRVVSALAPYWWMRGRRTDGALLTRELALRIGPVAPAGLGEEFAVCVLNAAFDQPTDDRLAEHRATAAAYVNGWTEPPRQPFVSVLHALLLGPPDGADAGQSRDALIVADDPWLDALLPMGEGMLALFSGQSNLAAEHLDLALVRFREIGERWGLANTLGSRGQLTAWFGDTNTALILVDEALTLTTELGATHELFDLLLVRAEVNQLAGQAAAAKADFERDADLATRSGAVEKSAQAELGLAELALQDGELAEARDRCERALANKEAFGRFDLAEAKLHATSLLGRIHAGQGDVDSAWTQQRITLRSSFDWNTPHVRLTASVLVAMADLAVRAGDGTLAARLLGAADAERGEHALTPTGRTRAVAGARDLLGGDRYAKEHQVGANMTRMEIRTLTGIDDAANVAGFVPRFEAR